MSIKQVSEAYPPNYSKILETFPECLDKAVFAYGDTICNPFKLKITPDLAEHENVHSVRQGLDPEGWWNRYLTDDKFRLNEEVEAFAVQYAWVKRFVSARNAEHFLGEIAKILAGPLYDIKLDTHQAKTRVRHRARELQKLSLADKSN